MWENNGPFSTMKPRHIYIVGNGGVNTDSLRNQENVSMGQQSVRQRRTKPHTQNHGSFLLPSMWGMNIQRRREWTEPIRHPKRRVRKPLLVPAGDWTSWWSVRGANPANHHYPTLTAQLTLGILMADTWFFLVGSWFNIPPPPLNLRKSCPFHLTLHRRSWL